MQLPIGTLSPDLKAGQLFENGRPIRARPKAWAVLCCLARSHGNTGSTEELLASAWPDSAVSDQALTNLVSEPRRILGRGAQIENVRGEATGSAPSDSAPSLRKVH